MKRFALLTLLLLFCVHFIYAQTRGEEYIGYRYKGVPPGTVLANGVRHLGGSLLGDVYADPVYGTSIVTKGKTKMIWLEVSTGQDQSGVTGWRVLDGLAFYNRRANDQLLDPSIECRRNGKRVENLVGIGRIVRQRSTYIPSALWVANLRTRRFDPVSTAGMKCIYSEP